MTDQREANHVSEYSHPLSFSKRREKEDGDKGKPGVNGE